MFLESDRENIDVFKYVSDELELGVSSFDFTQK